MDNREPKVSVCIITYNHSKFIKETLNSVFIQQTSFPYEVIVADDCSTDGNIEILKQYKQKYFDKINLIINQNNIGAIKNFNQALKACRGEYIAILDGDDRMLPGKLQKQVNSLDNYPDCVICAHEMRAFDSDTGTTIPWKSQLTENKIFSVEALLNVLQLFTFSSSMFRRKELPKSMIDERIRYIGDMYLNLSLATRGNIIYLNEILGKYRVHANSVTKRMNGKMYFNDMAITLEMARTILPNNLRKKLNKWEAYAYLFRGIAELEDGELMLARKDFIDSIKKKPNHSRGQFFYLLWSFMPKFSYSLMKKFREMMRR